MTSLLSVSVIAPVHNEREALTPLVCEIESALSDVDFELICVDDGSTDGSGALLRELGRARPWLHTIALAANFGQTAAIAAGIAAARRDSIVLIDSDGQNDPADIPRLLSALQDGADVASGWRRSREEGLLRRVVSGFANRLLRRLSGAELHDSGCSLKAYRADVLRSVTLLRDDHRFLPTLAAGLGAKTVEIPVADRPRKYGSSHYNLSRLPRVITDLFGLWMLLRFRGRPLRAFAWLGAMGFVAWSLIATALLLSHQGAMALIAAAQGSTVLLAAVAYGAGAEERRRADGRSLYRIVSSESEAERPEIVTLGA
jgi:glycosyltransferase involved in cell wall biosynthesis